MDFLESAFQFCMQKGPFKKKESQHVVRFAEIQKSLNIIAKIPISRPTTPSYEVVAGREFVGGHGSLIYLPEKIDFFDNSKLNRMAYINLLLLTIADTSSAGNDAGHFEQRLRFLKKMPRLNRLLDESLSGYQEWQQTLFAQVQKKENGPKTKLLLEWYVSRLDKIDDTPTSLFAKKMKLNEQTPADFYILLPCKGVDNKADHEKATELTDSGKSAAAKTTERKKTYRSVVEKVDLEKEKANPVTHSFEKMETADEYSGGRRFDSGDDDLDSHQAALDELDLSKVTLGGESAKSIFRSDEIFDKQGGQLDGQLRSEHGTEFFYDEWNYRKRHYLKRHCRLVETHIETERSAEFKLTKKQKFEVQKWRRKLEAILSRPIIFRKLRDGDEIDYDEYVREWSDLIRHLPVQERWYMQKRPRVKDASIAIVFDQSMSSDSWVNNKRVADVISQSLLMLSEVFDGVLDQVLVAGTSSQTRRRINFDIFKDFDESWNKLNSSLSAIEPRGYTRLGPAVRHAAALLEKRSERDKILILITDAKPTDLDGYEGLYGIFDVKFALMQAKAARIKSFSLAVDEKEKSHFERMFTRYAILNDPDQMAEEMFKILVSLI